MTKKTSTKKRISKIGIALAAYKPNVEYLSKQLQSIVDQSHKDWFCIIKSDSSIDAFIHEEPLKSVLKDSRITVIENPKRLGVIKNFEFAIKDVVKQKPDAIAFSDQDDIWHKGKLKKQIAYLQTLPPLSLVHTNLKELRVLNGKEVFGEKSVWEIERRNVEHSDFTHLLMRNVVTGATLMMDTALAEKYPDIPTSMNIHDHWFALAASLNGGVYALNECLTSYRQHEGNLVGVNSPLKINKDIVFNFPKKVRAKFSKSMAMLRSFDAANSEKSKLFMASDLGRGLFEFGIKNVLRDPVLAKNALGLAIGKYLVSVKAKARF